MRTSLLGAFVLGCVLLVSKQTSSGTMGIMRDVPICIDTNKPKTMIASWYKHGKITANGEKFKPRGLTAAHRTLPFNTRVRVTYEGKSVTVRINDRGPYIKGRQLDLTYEAAKEIGCIEDGVCEVEYVILKRGNG